MLNLLDRCQTRFVCICDHDTVFISDIGYLIQGLSQGNYDLVGVEERIEDRQVDGILLLTTGGNTVGGAAAGAGNLVSGNTTYGVWVSGGTSTGNTIQGNIVGLNAAHSAALGIRFYTGKMFPGQYHNAAFIARHGSWNRTKKIGGDVIAVYFNKDGSVKSWEPFLTGFLQNNAYIGRPVDLLVMKDGRPWIAGVRDPRDPSKIFASAEISDQAFSTSGDYERAFVKDGVRYHHILDPRTGYPTKTCRSVTVVAKDAFTADAWDTTLFIMGPERGLKLLKKMPDIQAVFVDSKNQLRASPGLTLLEGDVKKHLAESLVGKILILKRPTDAP